jgi:hypothetical protein
MYASATGLRILFLWNTMNSTRNGFIRNFLGPAVKKITWIDETIMQLVPVIPQPKVGVEERLKVAGVVAVKSVHSLPEPAQPFVPGKAHALPRLPATEIAQREQRQFTPLKDRRLVCRRFHQLPVLEELRSAIDRRKHNQRSTDFQLHIDEQA